MTNHILRDDAVKEEMDKQSTVRMVDMYLSHLLAYKEMGYVFTEEQSCKLVRLWQVVKGGEDAGKTA